MDGCVICQKHPIKDGVNLYRVNEFGVKGKWACDDHIHLFPNKLPDPEVMVLVNTINPPKYQ